MMSIIWQEVLDAVAQLGRSRVSDAASVPDMKVKVSWDPPKCAFHLPAAKYGQSSDAEKQIRAQRARARARAGAGARRPAVVGNGK